MDLQVKRVSSRTTRSSKEEVVIDMDDMEGRIQEVFEMFDKDNSGQLDMLELRDALYSLNPHFSVVEVSYYCKWINETGNKDGLISHKEFMDWLRAGSQAAQDLCQLIIAETGLSTAARLRDLFKRFDKDGSGTLDVDEMAGVFRVLKPALTFKEIAALMKELDRGGDHRVSRAEFMTWLRKGSASALDVKKEIIASTGIRWEQRIRKAFQTYDIDSSGLMDLDAMANALKNLGSLTAEEVRNVCADLDKSKDRHISYAEFRSWIKNGMGTREIEKAKAILAPSDSDGLEAVFYNFCGAGKAELDGKNFFKLCEDCQLLDPKMNSAQVDLIFCDTRVKKKGTRTIDVVQFEVALEILAERTGVPKQDLRMEVLMKGKPEFRGTAVDSTARRTSAQPKRKARKSSIAKQVAAADADLGAAPAVPPPKLDVSGLWKVLGRHTPAGRRLWSIYGEKKPRETRPRSPRPRSPTRLATRPSSRSTRRVSPDFSDLCVRVVND